RVAAACWVSPCWRMALRISITSLVLIWSVSASGSSKSAKTLPDPRETSIPSMTRFFMSSLLGQCLSHFQPGADDVKILFRRGDAMLTLFLETMQDEDRLFELHGIHRSIRAAPVVFDHFKHAGASETREHLRIIMLIASLSQRQRVPEESPNSNR